MTAQTTWKVLSVGGNRFAVYLPNNTCMAQGFKSREAALNWAAAKETETRVHRRQQAAERRKTRQGA